MIGTSVENYGPGDLALIGSDVPHAYASSAGTTEQEAIVVQFRREFLGSDFFGAPEFADVGRMLDVSSAAAATVFEADASTIERCQSLQALSPSEQTLALLSLLVELAGRTQSRKLDNSGLMLGLSPDARERVNAVCEYLQERFTGSIRLTEVAEVAHMSEAAFSRFFRRSLGRTMTQYVMELRVARASQLLGDSALSISDIAFHCGYGNLSNFNRCFRALKGRSPRQYRRALAQIREQIVY